jgi:hypothetical protein
MARPYIASGKSGLNGVLIVAAAAIGSGLVIGVIEGFVSRWFNLLLIFPAVLGAVAGGAAATAVESRKVRRPLVAGLLGFLGATVATAALHGMAYRDARALIAEAVRELGSSDGKTASMLLLKGCSKGCALHDPMLELKSVAGLNTSKRQEATVYRSLVTQSEAQAMRAQLPVSPVGADAPRPMYGAPPM